MNRTAIEWTDFTWNPVVGCSRGCSYCYARRLAKRMKHRCQECYDFTPHMHRERLREPLTVKKPSKIFVCSMGELFDPELGWARIWGVLDAIQFAQETRRHTFQVLTKRPDIASRRLGKVGWPNMWLGVSVEDAGAKERMWQLTHIPAGVRFVSFEPLLGDMGVLQFRRIEWVIIGAQTGPGAVRTKPEWVQGIIDQAREQDVPLFVKNNVGWPETIREWPT